MDLDKYHKGDSIDDSGNGGEILAIAHEVLLEKALS